MTGRPQLAVGTSGAIRIYPERDGYQARTTYRDFDGRSYQVRRHGKTKGAAQRALAQAIRDRGRQVKNSALAPESKVITLAEMWWATNEASHPVLRIVKLLPRKLLLPTWCIEMLQERWENKRSESEIVFPAPKGDLRDPSNTSADLKDAFTIAGYEWMTSHALRRTVATLMSKAGLMALEASDQLGHRRTSMTSDRYFDRSSFVTSGARVLDELNASVAH